MNKTIKNPKEWLQPFFGDKNKQNIQLKTTQFLPNRQETSPDTPKNETMGHDHSRVPCQAGDFANIFSWIFVGGLAL